MNHRTKHFIIGLIALTFICSLPPAAAAKTFKEWFCGLLGIDPKVYDKLTRARGPEKPIAKGRLMKLNLQAGTEEVVWDCDACWSPVTVSSTNIAVLRKDPITGRNQIWIVPVSKPENRRQVFAGTDIDMLIGRASRSNRLLLAQKDANCGQSSDGSYSIRQIDLNSGNPKLEQPADLPQQCISLIDAVPKPNQIRNAILLSNSDGQDINSGQRIRRELTKLPLNNKYFAPLAPQLKDDSERYDPIWLNDGTVIYILSQWSPP